jgi:uncharacterized protein (TIGR00369 family)
LVAAPSPTTSTLCDDGSYQNLGHSEARRARQRAADRPATCDSDAAPWWFGRAWGPGWIKKRWQPHPDLLNVDGSLFGGYIAALADQALAFAAMTVVPADCVFRTTNLNVNFIRVGRAHPLEIEAVVVAQTRRLLTVRATLKREDGELIADASAQQVLQPPDQARTLPAVTTRE